MMVFMRASAFLLVLPFFSVANFPVTVRVAMAAMLALLLAPLLPHFPLNQLTFFGVIGAMIQEVAIGLLLGFISRMVFYAADLAGNIAATEMGLNMATLFNPLDHQNTQAPSTILFFLAAVVMFSLDLHHWILLGFKETYSVLPMGHAQINPTLFTHVVRHTARIFMVGLQISAPIIGVSFVVTLVFGVLSRAVPQMNVFNESMNFRIVGGLIVFGFTLQLTAQHVMNYLRRLPDDLLIVAQMMSGGGQ
jgi:flagellar biosynthetic protein FliR